MDAAHQRAPDRRRRSSATATGPGCSAPASPRSTAPRSIWSCSTSPVCCTTTGFEGRRRRGLHPAQRGRLQRCADEACPAAVEPAADAITVHATPGIRSTATALSACMCRRRHVRSDRLRVGDLTRAYRDDVIGAHPATVSPPTCWRGSRPRRGQSGRTVRVAPTVRPAPVAAAESAASALTATAARRAAGPGRRRCCTGGSRPARPRRGWTPGSPPA